MLMPDELGAMVQDVLNHLYDSGYLQRHPLADHLCPGTQLGPRERIRTLRTLMLELIEELNPGPDVSFRAARARMYSVLNLHYVEGMTVQEAARELAISERQLYRDLRRAEQTVAQMMTDRIAVESEPSSQAPARNALLREELGRLRANTEEADVASLLDGAVTAVRSLCQQRGVSIEVTREVEAAMVYTDPLLARQLLVSSLSWVVQNGAPGTVAQLVACGRDNEVRFEVTFTPSSDAARASEPPPAARSLAEHLGGRIDRELLASGRVRYIIALGRAREATALVVDDNAGMLELFQRYLADQDYRLIGAQNGVEGLRLAEEQQPDVIILDVMMPLQDGWEVLQILQNRPRTRHIPVVVCSVLDDPELAFSLGAAEFLAKPVTRSRLLAVLARCAGHSRVP